jgi:hypothetical protein
MGLIVASKPSGRAEIALGASLVLVSALVWLASCGEVLTRPGCPTPGTPRACACGADPVAGQQLCLEDRVWSECDCTGIGGVDADVGEDPGLADLDDAGDGGDADDDATVEPLLVRLAELRNPALGGPPPGTIVTVLNVVVIGIDARGFWVQDPAVNQWGGIRVWYDRPGLNPGVLLGSEVHVTGEYIEFPRGAEDGSLSEIVISRTDQVSVGGVVDVPAPLVVSPATLTDATRGEPYESMLVRVEAVTVDERLTFGRWSFAQGYGLNPVIYDYNSGAPTVAVGTSFGSVTGVHYWSFGNFELAPRFPEDFTPPRAE